MHFGRISLVNFKSYRAAELELHPRINCLVGDNGQGKTNLLDAIYYLCMTKSHFNPVDSQNIAHSQDFFVIQGDLHLADRQERLHCGVKRSEGKVFKRNGKEYERLSDHVGLAPVVIVSPADMGLITEGGEERRRFMNSVIAQYNRPYLEQMMRYNRLLASRNKLLREASPHGGLRSDLLEVLDYQLDALAGPIHALRAHLVERITPLAQELYATLSGGGERVELQYLSHLNQGPLAPQLREAMARDAALQHTGRGVHRDDLLLSLNGNPIRREGSQGQQKSFLIALKLAQFLFMQRESGVKPLLLLDDIFDKLDMRRVQQLVELVGDDGFGQIFITDTNQGRLEALLQQVSSGFSLFQVRLGAISPG